MPLHNTLSIQKFIASFFVMMLKLFANFPQESFLNNRNHSPNRDRITIVKVLLDTAIHCAAHTVFSSHTMENVNVASVKILAPRTNAQSTANVQWTSQTNKVKPCLCRCAVNSRNPDSAQDSNNNHLNARLSAAMMLTAVETTSAVQLVVHNSALLQFKSEQQHKLRIITLKLKHQAWKTFLKTN
jgi:hypothetical protein